MTFLLLLASGYIIGSASPGYFFGRIIKRIDIRDFGNRNTGASNTYRVVGPVYGLIAGAFDLIKAPLVYYLGLRFGVHPDLALLAGLAAVLGHIFPFYLGLRGGKGVASLTGLLLISLFYGGAVYSLLLLAGMLVYYLGFVKPAKISLRHWLKLFSIIFPLGLIWLPSEPILWALGAMLAASFLFDLARFLSPALNEKYLGQGQFSKSKERIRFSGYTTYLSSSFLVLAFFPKEVAVISLLFFVLGDFLAPFSASTAAYLPKTRLIGDKTIGGAAVVFAISFLAGWFLNGLTPLALSLEIVVAGAFFTALFDQLSFRIDDNLLVPLGTATALWFLVSTFFA